MSRWKFWHLVLASFWSWFPSFFWLGQTRTNLRALATWQRDRTSCIQYPSIHMSHDVACMPQKRGTAYLVAGIVLRTSCNRSTQRGMFANDSNRVKITQKIVHYNLFSSIALGKRIQPWHIGNSIHALRVH